MKMVKPGLFVLVLMSILGLSAFADLEDSAEPSRKAVGGGRCGNIIFNCDIHKMTLNGVSSPINCGRGTPSFHRGSIGAPRRAAGTYWPSMAGAPVIDIGLGAILVHMLPPKNGRTPAGYNTKTAHTGCINVSPQMMSALTRCKGASYEIQYASKGGRDDTRYARRASTARQQNPQYANSSVMW